MKILLKLNFRMQLEQIFATGEQRASIFIAAIGAANSNFVTMANKNPKKSKKLSKNSKTQLTWNIIQWKWGKTQWNFRKTQFSDAFEH